MPKLTRACQNPVQSTLHVHVHTACSCPGHRPTGGACLLVSRSQGLVWAQDCLQGRYGTTEKPEGSSNIPDHLCVPAQRIRWHGLLSTSTAHSGRQILLCSGKCRFLCCTIMACRAILGPAGSLLLACCTLCPCTLCVRDSLPPGLACCTLRTAGRALPVRAPAHHRGCYGLSNCASSVVKQICLTACRPCRFAETVHVDHTTFA
jgi:hypothetical protein